MKRLAILGASGHGKVIADMALALHWDAVDFYDDAWPGKKVNGAWRIVGRTEELLVRKGDYEGIVVGIGDCETRWNKHQVLRQAGATLVTLIHPHAWVSPRATLGIGTVVMAGAVINVDAFVGEACIINTGATVDHDCQLEEAVHVCPGAHLSGNVRIGRASWVGVGAAIRQSVTIGHHAIVGAGATVIANTMDGVTVLGTPARQS